ncbi:MAG: DNA/pantothenate metabolism flavoprotein domain protein [Pedosphaera sp.]|nr:DNA/pantothenate metabolism flavoprotein domain protein [Pedosphaera sp.]MST00819.1 DNA/pantothenate metabolism flavoprotein domain protein [Pedosphaera sp.]
MNCVVTAGPTYEPLDAVRRLTNFSTGTLGSQLANFLVARGHQVTLLLGEGTSYTGEQHAQRLIRFTTTEDLSQKIATLATEPPGAFFHAAAVSDFRVTKLFRRTPGGQLVPIEGGKIPTRFGTLVAELTPTPKIISRLRLLFPDALLVGWKYEVDGRRASVLRLARNQMKRCQTNACVANGRAYGHGYGLAIHAEKPTHCETVENLFVELAKLLEQHATHI